MEAAKSRDNLIGAGMLNMHPLDKPAVRAGHAFYRGSPYSRSTHRARQQA